MANRSTTFHVDARSKQTSSNQKQLLSPPRYRNQHIANQRYIFSRQAVHSLLRNRLPYQFQKHVSSLRQKTMEISKIRSNYRHYLLSIIEQSLYNSIRQQYSIKLERLNPRKISTINFKQYRERQPK